MWDHVDLPITNNTFVICHHCKTKYPKENSKWEIKWSGKSTSNIIWNLKSIHKIFGPSNNIKRQELEVLSVTQSQFRFGRK